MLHAAALLLCAASLDQALPAVRKIADGSGATIGVSAVHIESGCRMSLRGDEPFPMQSVYKVAIAVHVLRRGADLDSVVTLTKDDIRLGVSPISDLLRAHPERPVTRTVRELLQSAVQISDNAASDAVLRLGGGPKAVMATLRELHVSGINVTESEGNMAKRFFSQPIARYLVDANNTATPNGMTDLLVAIQSGRAASPESTRFLLKWMTDTTTGANRLRALLPPGTVIAHKTGTSGDLGGVNGCTNDAGIITLPDGRGHLALSVFTKGSTRPETERERPIAAIARVLYDLK